MGSWVTYDVANTVFWTGTVGVSFPLWITSSATSGDDATLGLTLGTTMAVVMVLSPFLGTLSDQARTRMPFLAATTLVSVAAGLFIGVPGVLGTLILFAVSLAAMELGVIFYNSLLAEVSTDANRGRVAGLGVGIGFLGSFIAVGTAFAFASYLDEPDRYEWTIRVVALLFLVFAVPILFLLKERPRPVPRSSVWNMVATSWFQLMGDFRSLHRFPGLRIFLAARFLYALGINTTTAFGVVYASEVLGLSDREVQLVLLAGICFAIPSGAFWGRVVDQRGPLVVLGLNVFVWTLVILLALSISWFSWSGDLWWVVGCMTGIVMAGVWTADRPLMLRLTPEGYTGEFFGLHSMVGKVGRVLGPLMWAGMTSLYDQEAAVLCIVIIMASSLPLLTKVPSLVSSRREVGPQ